MQAERTKLVTGEVTRLRPYIARSAPRIAEISFAQSVQVSNGYRLAARRSSLMYGRNKLGNCQHTMPSLAIEIMCRLTGERMRSSKCAVQERAGEWCSAAKRLPASSDTTTGTARMPQPDSGW